MNGLNLRQDRSLVSIALLCSGFVVLTSCSKQMADSTGESAPSSAVTAAASKDMAANVGNGRTAGYVSSKPQPPKAIAQQPQLVKTAELSLKLDSIDSMMLQLKSIVRCQQGDIYNFQDDRPQESGRHRSATLVLKVPNSALDETLAAIIKLGRVESQAIKSEDVSQQLVDTDARLKNLRQQEQLTRKIMERSGSVKDILAVSQELSSIREQIEQLDATVKNLRQQVAYSTINLKVEEIKAAVPTNDAFGVRVQETWKDSTHAAGSLMSNLALGLLWLLPFAPVIALGVGGAYYIIRRHKRLPTAVETPTSIDLE